MKNYKFLIKPLFFIFNLLFASWIVIQIEKLNPSGRSNPSFGRQLLKRTSLFSSEKICNSGNCCCRKQLKNLFMAYRNGSIDSLCFNLELEFFFNSFQHFHQVRTRKTTAKDSGEKPHMAKPKFPGLSHLKVKLNE